MTKPQPTSWHIDALPFVWEAQPEPQNKHGLPDTLPFVLSIDMRSGLLIQEPNDQVSSALGRAYELGSILGSNVDEQGIGRSYADDFLEFIIEHADLSKIQRNSVLEVGCGNGYLLSRIQESFGRAIGVEPGPQGQAGAERFGVTIVQDFFPSALVAGRYSAIVLTSVLEHVQDPVELARSLVDYLEPGGRIFISVPNEESYISSFDVSTLFHEHWSYFDRSTLKTSMELAGLFVESCQESSFGGSLYACLAVAELSAPISSEDISASIDVARLYIEKASDHCERLRIACERLTSDGKTLGVYVPARFINAMHINKTSAERIRFFDDDPVLAGTYYPAIPVAIENQHNLLSSPVDTVLIMSRTFGVSLAEKLSSKLPVSTKVITIADLLD